MAREVGIVAYYGASAEADAYYVGITAMQIVGSLISAGIAGAVLLPLIELRLMGAQSSLNEEQLESELLGLAMMAGAVAVILVVIGGLAYVEAIELISGRALARTEMKNTVLFSAPAAGFLWVSGCASALANRRSRFFGPAAGNLTFSCVSLLWLVVAISLDRSLSFVAIGLTAGAIGNAAVSLASLRRASNNCTISFPSWELARDTGHRALGLWGVVGLGHIGLAGERAIASVLPAGAVAIVSVGRRVAAAASNIAGDSIATVVFPEQSRTSAESGRVRRLPPKVAAVASAGAALLALVAAWALVMVARLGLIPAASLGRLVAFVPLAAGLSWFALEFRRVQALTDIRPAAIVAATITAVSLIGALTGAFFFASAESMGLGLAFGPVAASALARRFGD